MTTTTRPRWWVLPDTIILTLLHRVEAGTITASEAYALLLEHTRQEDVKDGQAHR